MGHVRQAAADLVVITGAITEAVHTLPLGDGSRAGAPQALHTTQALGPGITRGWGPVRAVRCIGAEVAVGAILDAI